MELLGANAGQGLISTPPAWLLILGTDLPNSSRTATIFGIAMQQAGVRHLVGNAVRRTGAAIGRPKPRSFPAGDREMRPKSLHSSRVPEIIPLPILAS